MVNRDLDLVALERKARLAQHEDGLAEILAGVLSASFAAWMLTDRGAWGAIVPALAVVALARVRRWLRYPRVGYMRPSSLWWPGQGRMWAVITVGSVIALCALCFITARHGATVVTDAMMAGFLVAAAVLAFAVAEAMTGLARWYAYAGALAVAAVAAHFAGLSIIYCLLIAGGLLIVWGLLLMVRFIRKYPVLSESAPASGYGNDAGGEQ